MLKADRFYGNVLGLSTSPEQLARRALKLASKLTRRLLPLPLPRLPQPTTPCPRAWRTRCAGSRSERLGSRSVSWADGLASGLERATLACGC